MPSRLVCALLAAALLRAEELPRPTGRYGVGRMLNAWIGETCRIQLWYPAAANTAEPALYLPQASRITAPQPWRDLYGPAWSAIQAGLKVHARDNSPAKAGRWPVLLFSHGGGTTPFAYTVQLEELASHGFAVVAVEHFGDAVDDTLAPIPRVETPSQGLTGEARDRWFAERRARDLSTAIDQLPKLSAARHLDTKRIGAFGHSIGGRAAGLACQTDVRVRACLNQDGHLGWQPLWPLPGALAIRQPYLVIDQYQPDLPAQAYAQMKTTRDAYNARRAARQQEARDKIYARTGGGSHRVTLRTPGVSHNSFADIRLLGRVDGAGINLWPAELRAGAPHAELLREITDWSRAFFAEHLNNEKGALARQAAQASPDTQVETFAPVRARD